MAQIGQIQLKTLRFPGRAGELQAAGETASLIRELGDHYRDYHAFLATEMRRYGGRPSPSDFDNKDEFFAAWTYLHEVVKAEALIRNCMAYRRSGRDLGAAVDPTVPLVDKDDQLQPAE